MLVIAITSDAQSMSLPEWRVEAVPLLALEDDGRPETEFQHIVGAWRFENGAVVVANAGSHEIRLFSDAGKLIASFGRQGGGPGEFYLMRYAWRLADTLFVYDPILKRVTSIHVGAELRLLATLPISARGSRDYHLVGQLADRRLVAIAAGDLGWEAAPGVHRVEDAVGLVKADGKGSVEWLFHSPGLSILVHNPTRNIREARMGPTAFSPDLLVQAIGGTVWIGNTEASRLVRYEATARRLDSINLPLSAERPSDSLVFARRSSEGERPEDRDFLKAKYSAANLPARLPVFEAMVPGAAGEMWIQKYSGLPVTPALYLVLDGGGKAIAKVAAPAGFRLTEAGADYLLGVHRDEDGVETVRLYRVRRRQ